MTSDVDRMKSEGDRLFLPDCCARERARCRPGSTIAGGSAVLLPQNKHAERSLGALDPCAVPQSCIDHVDQHVLAQARRSVAISRLVRSHSQLFSRRWTGQLGRSFLRAQQRGMAQRK